MYRRLTPAIYASRQQQSFDKAHYKQGVPDTQSIGSEELTDETRNRPAG